MDRPLYYVVRALVALVQRLPLRWAARLGRAGGALAYWFDRRHRRVALRNLTMCFEQEKAPAEIRSLARENFRRLGEGYVCAIKTAAMSVSELRPHVEIVVPSGLLPPPAPQKPQRVVVAVGHFGNFELYGRFGQFVPGFQCATTYRALRQPSLNRLLQSLRAPSGCLYFERRSEGSALKALMNQPGILLGLLSDQHAGDGGLRLPFLGHDCSTSAAPAVFALRYRCALFIAVVYRLGLAQWRIEASEEILTRVNGKPRSTEAIMRDVNRAFEAAVRRDPANWFWVHKRWKPRKVQSPNSKPQSPEAATAGSLSHQMGEGQGEGN